MTGGCGTIFMLIIMHDASCCQQNIISDQTSGEVVFEVQCPSATADFGAVHNPVRNGEDMFADG
jgi:hypothetical protein